MSYLNFTQAAMSYCNARGVSPYDSVPYVNEWGGQVYIQRYELVAREMEDLALRITAMRQFGFPG